MSRADVVPEDKSYSLVEVSKGEPPDEAATKLLEFDELDSITPPPDGPLEFYVIYDADGNEVNGSVEQKEDPCWDGYEMQGTKEQDGETVPNCVPKSDSKAADFVTNVYRVEGTDDFEDQTIGVAFDLPNSEVYVDWKNDEWPEDQQLDGAHVSIYSSIKDLEQATGNVVVEVDQVTLDTLETKMEVVKAEGVPDNAISVSDESEIPEDAQKIEGPRGGLYYVDDVGDADRDELIDALESVAEGDPGAEGQVDAIREHAVSRGAVMDAIEELHPRMQEQVFDELGAGDKGYEDASTSELIDAAEEVAANDVVNSIADEDMDPDEVRDNFDEWLSDSQLDDIKDEVETGDTDFDETMPDWDEVDEAVPRRPEETVDSWEENHAEGLEEEAEYHDMSVEEYRETLAEEYSDLVEESQAAVRIPEGLLHDVLNDGKLKNQHETGTSSGWLDPDLRENFESEYMGVDPDSDESDRPIYGYASDEDVTAGDDPDDLDSYGNASIRLSDDAKERATISFGDTLSANRSYVEHDTEIDTTVTPASDPDETALEPGGIVPTGDETMLEMVQNSDDITDMEMYNEMQFHGGVSVDDFEEIKFDAESRFGDPPDDELLDRLDEAGIDYEVNE